MERHKPTRAIALRVGWAILWRFALCFIVILLAEGLLIGVLVAMFKMSAEAANTLTRVVSFFVGLPLMAAAACEAIYRTIDKRFEGFELAVLRPDSEENHE